MNENLIKMLVAAQLAGAQILDSENLDINDEIINKKFELISKLTEMIYKKYA